MPQTPNAPAGAPDRAGGDGRDTGRPLHLVFVLHVGTGGGIEHAVPRIASGLAGRGHRVDALYTYARAVSQHAWGPRPADAGNVRMWALHDVEQADGAGRPAPDADCSRLRGRVRASLKALRSFPAFAAGRAAGALGVTTPHPALFEWIERHKPDVVFGQHTVTNLAVLATCSVAGAAGVPVVHRWMTAEEHGNRGLRSHFRTGTTVPLWRKAPVVVSVSAATGREAAAAMGFDTGRMRVIPNPFDFDRIAELARGDPPDWPDDGLPVLVTVGRLYTAKDQGTLIRAAGELAARQRPARLLFFGEGPQMGALRRTAKDVGVERLVEFRGWIDNPFAYMRRADAFVLSSKSEGRPNVIIEALACGCPVVTTAWAGADEVTLGGRLGRIAPMGDPVALADTIAATLQEGRGDEDARAAAIRKQYEADAILDAYEEAARKAAAAPAPRRAPALALWATMRRSAARRLRFHERGDWPTAH